MIHYQHLQLHATDPNDDPGISWLYPAFIEKALDPERAVPIFTGFQIVRIEGGLSEEQVQEIEKTLEVKAVIRNLVDDFEHRVLFVSSSQDLGIVANTGVVRVYGHSKERVKSALAFFSKTFTEDTTKGHLIYALMAGPGGFEISSLGYEPFSIERDNYQPSTLKDYDYVIEEFRKPKPKGRIALLLGPPGTGKTYLLRALPHLLPDSKIVVVSPTDAVDLAGPSGLKFLAQRSLERYIFVIEDADSCLVPRSADNMGSISALLNMGDGIIGSALNIKILVTTNARKPEIDPAILRPGRLCRQIDVPLLDVEHANKVFNRLSSVQDPLRYKDPKSLATVYEDAFKSTL